VRTYLSALNFAHILKDCPVLPFSQDKLIAMCLTGSENCEIYSSNPSRKRRTVTLDSLLIIGHRLALKNWSELKKQTIWSACLVAFFTSARMGELLPNSSFFDPVTTLCWKHVKFYNDKSILIFLPTTKTTGVKGAFLDIFPFAIKQCCPSSALEKLRIMSQDFADNNTPVFCHNRNTPLTTRFLNLTLKELMSDIFIPGVNDLSCHSFRSALPSIISNCPEKSEIEDIKEWGHWKSDAILAYTRLSKVKRQSLFNKISSLILNSSPD